MSNERKLLELAAKAMGFSSWDWLRGDGLMNVYDAEGRQAAWNPITENIDALSLSVRLGICVMHAMANGTVHAKTLMPCHTSVELRGDNPEAATRLAIVRTAAEIAKLMP
jgi:hypothetical protein